MVSIKDIAARCGVSAATVSKSLNGYSDISETTRAAIRKVADEMGYMPNSAARALKTNRTYNLGVLFVDETMSGLTHEYFSSVLDSFKVEAEQRGYDITFINHNIGGRPTTYLEHCRYRGVDGAVVASVDFSDPQVLELMESDLPVVTIDHVFNSKTTIISDNITGMAELVRHVYQKGHRRIAFIHGEKTSVTENRLASFYKACYELGLEVPDEYVREGLYHDPKTCAKVTKELLALKKRPTCIFFPDDFSFIGGLNAITEAGLTVPEDISAVGYDGIYLSQVVRPKLTTYKQDTESLGREAAIHLIDSIERPKTTLPERILVKGSLQEGRSVKQL
ncbi:MAG: LacI family DNA-binding transcriptional regulator [Pygmaiobacter massiliensis]|uniref:LacI family DNA-binding transcriptional regulator n=1 Tax=Pygmaiobacter massiliensis TaxID=1917873 RepID=UPI002899C91E|nr:LacI family DNA-binding transcriptional regulator [Pygmaiobacter massiliensis]